MFEKVIVVDGYGHLLGRLASLIAKELLNGQRIVIVRSEEILISGSLFRNKIIFARYLRLSNNTNPRRGPDHYIAPGRILHHVIRGMIPHKTVRGRHALDRLKIYEGIPHPFNKVKRKVLPAALKTLRLKPGRKFCRVGDLASSSGWKHGALLATLESKRKIASKAYYNTKLQLAKLRVKAATAVAKATQPIQAQLAVLGY